MTTKQLWWLLPLACLAACDNAANHEKYIQANSAAQVQDSLMPAAVLPLNSPDRKIIRTADLNCKVDNVMSAVNTIEHSVTAMGGSIADSRMSNTDGGTTTIYYKPDSLKELHTYTTAAQLTLRVPTIYLDSLVHSIPSLVSFIDSRTLTQTDVTARYIGNNAIINTGTKVYSEKKAAQLAKKTEDLVKVQQYEDDNSQKLIERKVSQMELQDAVSYATVTVALSQPQQVYSRIIVNPLYGSTPPLGTRMKLALSDGWSGVQYILIALATVWPLLAIAGAALLVVWRVKKRFPARAAIR